MQINWTEERNLTMLTDYYEFTMSNGYFLNGMKDRVAHLGNTINNNQKNQIINLLIEIRDSGALKNGDFKGQAAKLSSQIENGAKNIFNKFNTPENRNLFQQIWDSIVNFFSGLFK